MLVDGCKGLEDRPPPTATADWDRVAFALQLVRDEYGEQMEVGDFPGIAALATILDGAVAALGVPATRPVLSQRARTVAGQPPGHEPPRTVAKTCTRLLSTSPAQAASPGARRPRPTFVGERPRMPSPAPPATARRTARCRRPPPTWSPRHRTERTLQTPYEIFNRITYGGAGTPMPSFSEALPESARWDIAFYLFADLWPPCAPTKPLPTLPAADLSYLSDRDLWEKYGWGSAACLRRNFR